MESSGCWSGKFKEACRGRLRRELEAVPSAEAAAIRWATGVYRQSVWRIALSSKLAGRSAGIHGYKCKCREDVALPEQTRGTSAVAFRFSVDARKAIEGGLFAFSDPLLLVFVVVVMSHSVVLSERRIEVYVVAVAIAVGVVPLLREGRIMTRDEDILRDCRLLKRSIDDGGGSSGCHACSGRTHLLTRENAGQVTKQGMETVIRTAELRNGQHCTYCTLVINAHPAVCISY